jgi:hypothetical protein
MEMICNFKRIEKKYLLSEKQYEALFRRTGFHLKPDEYGRSTVMSLYLDTPDHRIIRNSIEAINYKEKLRLRSYGTATPESTVFLELKKKFGGVVYKRRSAMTLTQACSYLQQKEKPFDTQIMSEIDWAMRLYRWPEPVILIACEREAWYDDDHPDLRLTFDRNIRYRENDLSFRHAYAGTPLLPDNTVLLEIKTAGAMPLWLADALDRGNILPCSFSKYGTAYTCSQLEKQIISLQKGDNKNVVNF